MGHQMTHQVTSAYLGSPWIETLLPLEGVFTDRNGRPISASSVSSASSPSSASSASSSLSSSSSSSASSSSSSSSPSLPPFPSLTPLLPYHFPRPHRLPSPIRAVLPVRPATMLFGVFGVVRPSMDESSSFIAARTR